MHLKSYDSEVNIMKVTAVVSTKGGPGKTAVGVNLGAFCADDGVYLTGRTPLKKAISQ